MDSGGVDDGVLGPDSLEIMSELILLSCVSIMAVGLGTKTKGESRATLTRGRVLVIVLYTASWAFAAMSLVVVSTNNGNMTSCTLGMIACDVFYAGCKMVIYAWMIERVHLVSAIRNRRFRSSQYLFHLSLLLLYVGIFVLMLTCRNIYLGPDGKCIIGLHLAASIPTMIYDSILNLYLTLLFVRPLAKDRHATSRKDWKKTRVYKLTRRTLVASAVCFLASFANGLVMVITQGHLRGLVCLTLCNLDVGINVLVVHWTTSTPNRITNIRGQGAVSQTNDTHTEVDNDSSRSSSRTIVKPPSPFSLAAPAQKHHPGQQSAETAIEMVDSKAIVGVIRAGTTDSGLVHFGSYNLAFSHRSFDHDPSSGDKHGESDSIQSLQSSVRPLQDN